MKVNHQGVTCSGTLFSSLKAGDTFRTARWGAMCRIYMKVSRNGPWNVVGLEDYSLHSVSADYFRVDPIECELTIVKGE